MLPWLLVAFAISPAGAADEAPPAPPEPARSVAQIVQRLISDTGAKVSVRAVRLSDGAVLCDADGERPMIPASNQKILTAAVALKRLGADFAFRTKIAIVGKDLVVFADGDPTIGDERLAVAAGKDIYHAFDRWAAAVKAAGVEKVPGDLVVRAGLFQPPMVHPDWPKDQLQSWYAAPWPRRTSTITASTLASPSPTRPPPRGSPPPADSS